MKKSMVLFLSLALLLTVSCTATNTVSLSRLEAGGGDILITTGTPDRAYRSIAITQVSVTGMWLFGYVSLMDAELDEAVREELTLEASKQGADAVINIQFYQIQYPPLLKILSIFAILSPQYAFVTGELVEFTE